MNPLGLSVEVISVVDTSVVVVTGSGQTYDDAPTHLPCDTSNMLAPGHFVSEARMVPSEAMPHV